MPTAKTVRIPDSVQTEQKPVLDVLDPDYELDFSDEVTDENMTALVAEVRDALLPEKGRHVAIYMNTQGGDLSAALSAYDRLRHLARRHQGRISTVATGLCLSSGVVLLQAGTERLATRHTTFMLHSPHQFAWDDSGKLRYHELEGRLGLQRVTMDLLVSVLADRTGVGAGDWKGRLERAPEDFFDAQRASSYGLIDRIL